MKHVILEELRIAKIVHNSQSEMKRIMKEAMIIKSFKHSGIPVIYDVFYLKNSICVIEEYISGNSLTQYIKNHKNLTTRRICEIGIELCDILEYMHNFGDRGVVHLDLKPEHVIIDENDRVHLIDFDHSEISNENVEDFYGTVGYAAPEQYHKLRLGQAADIYSLGMLFLFMSSRGHDLPFVTSISSMQYLDLYPVIKRCLKHSPLQRYHKVRTIRTDLSHLIQSKKNNSLPVAHNIYIYGTRRGVGTTHFSLCVSSFLSSKNQKTVFVDRCGRNDLLYEVSKYELTEDGFYYLNGAYLLPDYHNGIKTDLSQFCYRIYDCGELKQEEQLPLDGLIIVVSSPIYHQKQENCVLEGLSCDVRIVLNHISGKEYYRYLSSKQGDNSFYRMPCVYAWQDRNDLLDENLEQLLNEVYPELFMLHKSCRFSRRKIIE